MPANSLSLGSVIRGPMFPEPVEILATASFGSSVKVIGRGLNSGMTHDPVLTPSQLAQLIISADREPFDGDARMFRLGIEAQRLGLAYEYDPFFSLSIARVDPLPHQLEAVYDYFMRLPRIRFLLADDPGAGKTIMAGLLLKELKARGLVKRVLIVTPANLTFQWQREMADKFRERFEVIRGDVLRVNYGQNPWQERDQVVTSVSWVSIVEDARESLLRSRWDLVIVDEAHKMSARSEDHKTYAYRLGESLSKMTDHYLLMTATPHKGDPDHFRRFLALLDNDVYGSIQSLEQAMKDQEAPFYLRRTKEALVTFPDPETGDVRKLFTKREVRSAAFDLDGEELEFYDELTRYVEDQSMLAAADGTARGRAVGFTMAMLQRRMASSIYAVRRTLERMRARREKILADPEAYRQEQIRRRMPDDFDDLDVEERQQIIDELESEVLSVDPAALREEIGRLTRMIEQACQLEARDVQTKLTKLRSVLNEEGINLQFCWLMINFDIPWNPVRLEQRVGRIHRYGQEKDCLIFNFVAKNTREGRVLHKLLERLEEVERIRRHVEISLNALIDRAQVQQAEYVSRQIEGQTVPGLDGLIAQAEQHLDELNNRLESRKRELELERHSAISDITHLGRAWVVPHPERSRPNIAPMVCDDEIERIAVEVATRHEEERGWVVESVESENRGFDLISRRPHPCLPAGTAEDPRTFIEVRFIEVKGRAGVGVVALSENEYRAAERLKSDYWLYAVFNCAGTPDLHIVQNPARLGWQPVTIVEHYQLAAQAILSAEE